MTESVSVKQPHPQAPRTAINISGMPAPYENACQQMLDNGMRWLNDHPDFSFEGCGNYEGVTGIMKTPDTPTFKDFEKAMCSDINPSGAMHQAGVNHCRFIHENGWDKYLAEFPDDRKYYWTGNPDSCPLSA